MADEAITGLAALSPPQARVLLLGSMPGAASLAQQQYYAHPRNLFWPIMAELAGFSADLPYQEKVHALNASGIALWDVIASCQRAGSLDSAIRDEQVNDFAGFFASQPNLAAIGFNGGKAWQSFKRHVLPLQIVPAGIKLITLPSTSPAHAALGFTEKLQQWHQLSPFLLNVN
ncbi:TDG/mug DNA glycosylase family protein [Rheinheimera pacifica]|uniref:DNA-deoxyinosine glycosylase n=1 Tax=Rheinheimera pacifica TaxID=173990 RepID=UPI0021699908|nr:DNA-deoxyinosine glycosylase [Rheinheimera pacifica]MCS4308318.1 TDG/mug DNA glycosylase family protein [Rheinheimera pacifica]